MSRRSHSVDVRRSGKRTIRSAASATIEPLENRLLLTTIYQANMDANPGWASSGEWAYGIPAGAGGVLHGNPDPFAGATGSRVYGVNLNGDYNANALGTFYLTTQAINCAAYNDVVLQFQRLLNTDEFAYVSATVEVSNDNASWTQVYGNSASVTDLGWSQQSYSIGSVANGRSTVYVRWGYRVAAGAWAFSGWNIDDVVVTGTPSSGISIPLGGTATPYPATKTVTGMSGNITDINVTLSGVSHTWPDDIDVLLVGPGGQKAILMSDAGADADITSITLVFDDEATASLPQAQISTGTYKPTNYDTLDSFPAPAPVGPYTALLSAFDGTSPNGIWSLYVFDDTMGDGGTIASWDLNITSGAASGQITGSKWNDVDGDSTWDAAEPGLPNWRIYLDANTNGSWDTGETSVLTNASGNYAFTGLSAGTYYVGEVAQAGWSQVSPGATGMSAASSGVTAIDLSQITTTADGTLYTLQGERIGDEVPIDSVVHTQTNVTGPLINIDDFRADPRFAGIDGSGLATVIIDTGIDLNHPFFGPDADGNGVADRIVYQYDFSGANDGDASDTDGHGSNVSSIVASSDATYKGMAPAANIIHLKVFPDGSNMASSIDIEQALQWVVANATTYNVVSVNMSLGGGNYNTAVTASYSDEIAALTNAGVMVVAAAGNGFYDLGSAVGLAYPAADPNTIAVGAVYDTAYGQMAWAGGAIDYTTAADRFASFSQRTTSLYEILAPGPISTGAGANGGTTSYGGTSQASPHIAGIAALAQELAIQRIGRRLTLAEFRSLLSSTGATIGDGDDENDNVVNTGGTFKRVDVLALGNAIYNMGSITLRPYQHAVVLTAGQVVNDRNFGNQQSNPDVSLSISGTPMSENGGSATITATLSRVHTQPVTINLAFGGTATYPSDYSRSSTSITIAAGLLTGSMTLTAVQDSTVEAIETITVDISSVTNGQESGVQQVIAAINDDDVPPATISGSIWRDADADGIWDAAETGLANWEVYLDANVNGQWDSGETRTTTNASGAYTFTGVAPGIHVVSQTLQSGYQQTTPGASGTVKVSTIDSTTSSLAPAAGFVSIDSGPEGDAPRALAFTRDGNYVLVVNRDTDNVSVFNAATRAVVATVPVGDNPTDVAVSATYAVVTNLKSNSVSIINLSTWAVVATVPVTGTQPYGVKVTADGTKAVVGVINGSNAASPSSFSVIDLATRTEVRSFATTPQADLNIWFTAETRDYGIYYRLFALSPDNRTIVLPDYSNAGVNIYDLATGTRWASLGTAAAPTAVDISADGTTAVVSHEGSARRVTVIALAGGASTVTNALTTVDDLDNYVIRITPNKSHAVVTSYNNVMFVNLATGTTDANIPAGTIFDLEFSYDGQYLFVPGYDPDLISVAARTVVKTYYGYFAHESAASPTAMRIVSLESREAEEVQFYNVNGAAGSMEGIVLTGSAPEGDAPRYMAVSSDGKTAITGNTMSNNATIIDLETQTVRAYVNTGGRVQSVAISPDNHTAIVANMDSNTITIIDLTSNTAVKTLSVPSRPDIIVISPDSTRAYVTSVQGIDYIYFINLAGASSTVAGSLAAGNYGSVGYDFVEGSGLTLSPNGSILAACSSFTSEVILIDTATRTVIKAVGTGLNSIPRKAVFSPSGNTIYAINANTHTVSVINVNGASSSLTATISGMDDPTTINLDAAGAFLYVGNSGYTSPGVKVISTATNSVVASLTLPSNATPNSSYLSSADSMLYLMASDNSGMSGVYRVRAQGASSAFIDQVPLGGAGMVIGFSESLKMAVVSMPIADGVAIVDYSPRLAGSYTVKLDPSETIASVNFGEAPQLAAPVVAAEPAYTPGTTNTISWAAAVGAVDYYLEWDTSNTFASPDGNSGWVTPTSATATGLTNGQTYYYRVKARNAGGEGAWSNIVSSTQDATAPAAPVVSSISDDTGISNLDEITSDATLILTGTAEANSSVQVFRDGSAIGTTTANGSGAWTFDYTGTSLADGGYAFTARASDAAGNTSALSTALNVTVDKTGPTDLAIDDANVAEAGTASVVGSLSSTDPDAGDAFTYALVAGTGDADNAAFSIVGNQLWTAAGFNYETRQSYSVRVRTTDRAGNFYDEQIAINVSNVREATIAGRAIFYNRSYFDGNNVAANVTDDAAIATDKTALLPGQTATFANYTSYSRGINGIMVDITGLPGTLTASDFVFRVGNSNTVTSWALAPAPTTVDIRTLAGNTRRVTLIWTDNAIQKQWLQITVKASDTSDLAADDLFYFGNAIAESGNLAGNTLVNSTDDIGARANPHTPISRATVTDVYDYNRDSLVNSSDQTLARTHSTTPITALKLIAVPTTILSAQPITATSRPVGYFSNTRIAQKDDGVLMAFFDKNVLL